MQRYSIKISDCDIHDILAPMIHGLEYKYFLIVIGKLIADEIKS